VRVLARTPEKLGALRDKVEVVQGTMQDQKSVESLLKGCNAVLSAAGGVKEPNQEVIFREGTRILVDAMRKEGIKRLVSINGAGTILPNEKADFGRRLVSFIVGLTSKEMKVSKLAEMSVLLENTDIEWTSVRAGWIVDGPGTGHIMAKEDKIPGQKVMLSDLAKFMVAQISNGEWVHKAPIVASGSA